MSSVSPVTREALCRVEYCPEPNNPDWHLCVHCGTNKIEHHHVEGRGKNLKDKTKVVALCLPIHKDISLNVLADAILTVPRDGGWVQVYRIWDVHDETIHEGEHSWMQTGGSDGQGRQGEGVGDSGGDAGRVPAGRGVGASVDSADSASRLGAPSAAAKQSLGESPSATRGPEEHTLAAAPAASGLNASEEAADTVVRPAKAGRASSSAPESGSSSAALSHEQKLEKAEAIRYMQGSRQWLAGDTANEWVAEIGESAWQYLDLFGYTHPSLSNIMNICERIKPPIRNERLSWGRWQLLYSLKNLEDVEMYRDWAIETNATVKELSEKLIEAGLKPEKKPVKRWTLEELRELFRKWHEDDSTECEDCHAVDDFFRWLEEGT